MREAALAAFRRLHFDSGAIIGVDDDAHLLKSLIQPHIRFHDGRARHDTLGARDTCYFWHGRRAPAVSMISAASRLTSAAIGHLYAAAALAELSLECRSILRQYRRRACQLITQAARKELIFITAT